MKSLATMLRAACMLLAALAPALAAGETAYIKHSSGLVLGNSGGKAVIMPLSDAAAAPLQLEETADGWLNIFTTSGGKTLYLSKVGDWNTSFVESGAADEAKFCIDGERDALVSIVCKANNRCLGTDATAAGSSVYSDKAGNDEKYKWFITADPAAVPDLSVARFKIDAHNTLQTTEGWGLSLCWWANMCGRWPDAKIDKLIDWLVSPTGLNYNIFRYNIGGGDDPDNAHCTPHHMGGGKGLRAEMEGFKDSSADSYHWDRDAAQRKIMLKIKEKRPDAIFEAFSNTPPWYMTYSGCCSGNVEGGKDNLRPEYYEEFAHYLVDVCKHYSDEYGIEFRTLEPFNEANTDYWHCSGVQEGCHFDYESQINFIKVLYPILKESGLSTVISASDETAVPPAVWGFNEYKKAGILDMVGQWNTHTYWGGNGDRETYRDLVRPTGSRLWMSETGSGGNGLEGNLNMAQRLIDDIRYIQPDAWLDWQYMEENNDQWCLVRGSFADATFYKVKNYIVRQHFSKYIKSGYTFVGTDNEQTLAALSPTADTLVVVSLNRSASDMDFHATLANFAPASKFEAYYTDSKRNMAAAQFVTLADGQLEYTMPATSICTIIIPIADSEGAASVQADLMSWSVDGGSLRVDGSPACSVGVYSTSGAQIFSGRPPVSLELSQGVYLLSATDGARRQSATIGVR